MGSNQKRKLQLILYWVEKNSLEDYLHEKTLMVWGAKFYDVLAGC